MLARRAVQEYIITSIKEVLRIHFNRAVELKVSPEPGSLRSDMLVGSLLSRHTVSSASLLTGPLVHWGIRL